MRAGVLEHGTVERRYRQGVASRLHRKGPVHRGVNLQLRKVRHPIVPGPLPVGGADAKRESVS